MLKKFKSHQAQTNITEYVVVIFIVVGVMTAMGTFVKRAIQGRIYDARNFAFKTIKNRTEGVYNGKVLIGYEPYYLNTVSVVKGGETTTSRLMLGGASSKEFDSFKTVETNSFTAAPMEAD